MNPNSNLERHPDLYFADGDVVLAVKQTSESKPDDPTDGRPKYSLFRVHKFLLKHHSSVFANFFADANAAPAEAYDGVPLAEMHGDKAEDFALLLGYLYNPSSLVFRRNDPNTPLTVAGVIRLADKYLIEPLHRRLVEQVCDDWPKTLTEYDIKQGEVDALQKMTMSKFLGQYSADDDDRQRLSDLIPEPASAIMFAYEFGCPQILPAAFYRLSLIPVTYEWSSTLPAALLARWSVLDGESLLRCMRVCQALRLYRPLASQFLSNYCENATDIGDTDTPCYRFVARLIEATFSAGQLHIPTHSDPLRLLDKCTRYWEIPELSRERLPDQLCEECQAAMGVRMPEERMRIWKELPNYFNLG